ncbi:MAG: hypothetical protein PVS2B2_05040 [Candidatus Acidiferrum sp.]
MYSAPKLKLPGHKMSGKPYPSSWHLIKMSKLLKLIVFLGSSPLLALLIGSCNGANYGIVQPNPQDLCKCLPLEPDILDFRHLAKHTPIPNIAAQEIGIDTILSWAQDTFVDPSAPRTGRELQVFHVANAFLQEASVNAADCDVHFELSRTADKTADRVIVETPVDSEFCSARQNAQTQLAKHHFVLDSQHGGELAVALPVEVLGMAFEDFDHNRGSVQVKTIWELHPAIVTIP